MARPPVARDVPGTSALSSPGWERLFVYGTLRSGGGASGMLRGCRRLHERHVTGTLYDFGAYPALVPGGEGEVCGEVWECPAETIRSLDAYEGVPHGLFARVRVGLNGGGTAWGYVAGPRLLARIPEQRVVPGGRWRER
jgi:gamma-glutamylcyclotransferase (GGCT)/AIG2-like uncharacterized protein YtfP